MSAAVCPRRPVQLPYSERVNTMTGLRSELQLLNTASCLAQTDRTFGVVGGPVPTDARQGRHRQRYGANGERLVAGYAVAQQACWLQVKVYINLLRRTLQEYTAPTYDALHACCVPSKLFAVVTMATGAFPSSGAKA